MSTPKIVLEIVPRDVVPVPVEELDRLVRFARFGLLLEDAISVEIADPELSDGPGDAEQRALATEEVARYGELLRELLS